MRLPRLVLTKRKKIIFIALIVAVIFFGLHYFYIPWLIRFLLGGMVTYLLSLWAFDFDLKRWEYVILPLIPILFYLSLLLLYPILEKLNLKYLIYPLIVFGMYVILLTFNILNLATIKPIPLSKAAWVSFSLLRFVISFLVYTYLFWFHFNWYFVIFLIFIFTIFLTYPGFYLLIHQLGRGERSLYYIATVTLCLVEVGFLLNFWKLPFFGSGLFLAASLYVLIGILEAHLKAQLSRGFFWEYGVVVLFAGLLLFLL